MLKNLLAKSRSSVSFPSRPFEQELDIPVVVFSEMQSSVRVPLQPVRRCLSAGTGEVCPTARISGDIDSQSGPRNEWQVCNVKHLWEQLLLKRRRRYVSLTADFCHHGITALVNNRFMTEYCKIDFQTATNLAQPHLSNCTQSRTTHWCTIRPTVKPYPKKWPISILFAC